MAKVVALYVDGSAVQQIAAGQAAIVVLDTTPFYAESGGQMRRSRRAGNCSGVVRRERHAKNPGRRVRPPRRAGKGTLKVGDTVVGQGRCRTARAYRAQPLGHALDAQGVARSVGQPCAQKGSLVDAERTRFDFSHNGPLTADEIRQVEEIVNREIRPIPPTERR